MPDFLGGDYQNSPNSQTVYTGDYGFTTSTLMRRYFGDEGVELFSDDLSGSEQTSEINDAILQAEDMLMSYLLQRYEPTALQNNNMISRFATILAVYFLTMRRGHQPSAGLSRSFIHIQEFLEDIANNNNRVVPGANTRHEPAPCVNNYAVDNRLTRDRLRVVGSQSTGPYAGRKDLRSFPGIFDH